MSNYDGTIIKTNKPTLAWHIESRVASAKSIPLPSACIINGMGLINKISGDNRTFGDIAACIFMFALQSGNASSRITLCLMSIKTTWSKQQSLRVELKLLAQPMVVLLLVRRYNSGGDCLENQQVKLPSSNFSASNAEMIHTQRSLAANYSSLHVGIGVSKSLRMALRSFMNLLPPKNKLTHACCFTPNMLPVTIEPWLRDIRHRCVYHLPFSISSDKWHMYIQCGTRKQTPSHWH